jgi:hypothetical protein
MAKINQQNLVITLSSLIKDSAAESEILSADALASLEAVIAELAGAGVIVEIQQA